MEGRSPKLYVESQPRGSSGRLLFLRRGLGLGLRKCPASHARRGAPRAAGNGARGSGRCGKPFAAGPRSPGYDLTTGAGGEFCVVAPVTYSYRARGPSPRGEIGVSVNDGQAAKTRRLKLKPGQECGRAPAPGSPLLLPACLQPTVFLGDPPSPVFSQLLPAPL